MHKTNKRINFINKAFAQQAVAQHKELELALNKTFQKKINEK